MSHITNIDPPSGVKATASAISGYLRTAKAADYLGIGTSTLERKRIDGTGPQFRVLGSRIVTYAVADLDEWAARCIRTSTFRSGSDRDA